MVSWIPSVYRTLNFLELTAINTLWGIKYCALALAFINQLKMRCITHGSL